MDAVSEIYLKPNSVAVRNVMTCESDTNDDSSKSALENDAYKTSENREKSDEDPLAEEKTVEAQSNVGEGLNISIDALNNPLSPKDDDNNESCFNSDTTTVLDKVMVIVNEQDPMDLLMPLERGSRNSLDSEGSDDDSDDDESGTITKEERWLRWMTKFEWLLHEESNGDFAYCLYCDVTVHIGSIKYIKQHGISLYHQEREENYLAFKANEEQLGGSSSVVEIKQEYGTDNRVTALKYQRIAQAKPLSNFNWTRWIQAHCWLVREQDDGTIGYCKYCKTRLNVEFTYLRKRHEMSKGHREAERVYKKRESRKMALQQSDRGKKRKHINDEETSDEDEDNAEKIEISADEEEPHTNPENSFESNDDNWEFCEERLEATNPLLSRCTICDLKITRGNFRRHLKTKAHLANLDEHKAKQSKKIKEENTLSPFSKYGDQHPWLTSDPDDADVGYCKVCQKRFMYAHSELKRKVHEKGLMHRTALESGSSKLAGVNTDNEDTIEEESQTNDLPSTESINDEVNEEDSGEKKRKLRGSIDWYRKYPWCKPYLKDPNYMLCTYCNIVLMLTNKRKKHQLSKRHQNAEMNARKGKNQTKPVYSWLSYSNNKKVPFCKYCRVRFPNESSKAHHEHSSLHKQTTMQYMAKKAKKGEDDVHKAPIEEAKETQNQTPTTTSIVANRRNPKTIYAMVQQWKSRFPWISYKRNEIRANYCWCKLCEVSFYGASLKCALKHQRSGRHLRAKFQKSRLAKSIKSDAQSVDFREMFSWLDLEPDENYARCRFCDLRLTMKLIYIRQHENSKRHIMLMEAAESESSKADNQTENATSSTADHQTDNSKNSALEPDVLLIEDTDINRETNDIVSLKSESTTDAVDRFVDELQMMIEPPSKRLRTSGDSSSNCRVVDVCQSMLHAVDQLKAKRKDENSPLAVAEGILSSSFSIAACLSPLLQQLTTRQVPPTAPDPITTESNRNESASTSTPSKRDNIDLFFDSVGETLRSFPIDLIAEGKMKIMQIMYELEMTAMSRKNRIDVEADNNNSSSNPTPAIPNTNGTSTIPSRANTPPRPASPASITESSPVRGGSTANGHSSDESAIIINEMDDFENLLVSERTITSEQHSNRPKRIIGPKEQQLSNSNHRDRASNVALNALLSNNETRKRHLQVTPATVQLTASGEHLSKVRCVPLNTLTGQMFAKEQQKNQQQFKSSMPTYAMSSHSTMANHSTPMHIKAINGPLSTSELNRPTSLRQIRLNSSSQSKFITIKPCATSSTAGIRLNTATATNSALTRLPYLRLNSSNAHIRPFPK